MLHPDILHGDARQILTQEQLWTRAVKWIAQRANELCPDGRPKRSALYQAVRESGVRMTIQQIEQIWQQNQKELDDTSKCPIVVTSEREYREAIAEARERGDLFIGKVGA